MNRAAFLKSLGINGAALMAIYCMGGITACSSSKSDPQPVTPSPTPTPTPTPTPGSTKVDFTIDITTKDYATLQTVKGYAYKDNIIIVRTATDTFVALSKVCTHNGTAVEYQDAANRLYCPNHGSTFTLDGTVTGGPAPTALKKYNTTYAATTNTLRVFES